MVEDYAGLDYKDANRRVTFLRRTASLALVSTALFLSSVPATARNNQAEASVGKNQQSIRTLRNPLKTLTTADSVHSLTRSEAELHYPVHLRAVCIVCFAGWHGFFVNDGATSVYVETKNHVLLTAAVHPGTMLDIQGVTGAGEFAPIVDQSSLQVLGNGRIPPALPVSVDELSTGVDDGQWISFDGTVLSAFLRDSMLVLEVESGRFRVDVMTLPPPEGRFKQLINARVRILGSAGPILSQRRQLIGVSVYVPSLDRIKILRPGPADPFSLPLKRLSEVFEYTPATGTEHLVRIRGVVLARWGETVFISDGTQGAGFLSNDDIPMKTGDLVDAVGYPVLGDSVHTMDHVVLKRLGTAPSPDPTFVTAQEAYSGDYAGSLIRLAGRLVEEQEAENHATLLVDVGGVVIPAILPSELRENSFASLRDGSQIQITGICIVSETRPSRHFRIPKAFQILLRSQKDIVVIKSASWWTRDHTLQVLVGAVTGMGLVFVWVVVLRRRVAQQTARLRESEERFRHMALHDPLTGVATRLLLQDRMMVALEGAKRHERGVAAFILDLDKFKETNDTFGHLSGDQVLRATAERLVCIVRNCDTVARLGGDEFVVLLTELNHPEEAGIIADRIVAALSAPVSFEGHEIPSSVSVGVCTGFSGEFDAAALLRNADRALYRAKAVGGNGSNIFVPDSDLNATHSTPCMAD